MTPENLQSLMEYHLLNAKKVAGLLHVSEQTVYSWRSGRRNIPRLAWEHLLVKVAELREAAKAAATPPPNYLNLRNR